MKPARLAEIAAEQCPAYAVQPAVGGGIAWQRQHLPDREPRDGTERRGIESMTADTLIGRARARFRYDSDQRGSNPAGRSPEAARTLGPGREGSGSITRIFSVLVDGGSWVIVTDKGLIAGRSR